MGFPVSSESLSLVHPMEWISKTGGGYFVDSEHNNHRGPNEIWLFYCCWVTFSKTPKGEIKLHFAYLRDCIDMKHFHLIGGMNPLTFCCCLL